MENEKIFRVLSDAEGDEKAFRDAEAAYNAARNVELEIIKKELRSIHMTLKFINHVMRDPHHPIGYEVPAEELTDEALDRLMKVIDRIKIH